MTGDPSIFVRPSQSELLLCKRFFEQKKIKIDWLSDRYDCETCGTSYAEGARVYIDGELVMDLQPSAHCYGGESFEPEQVYRRLLLQLGYTVEDGHE